MANQNVVKQSVTGVGSVSIGLNDQISSVTVGITGTYAGFAAAFEAFDGTAWYPVAANRADGVGADLSVSALANTTRLWRVNTQGNDAFRVRVTAISSGKASITINPSSQVIMDIGSMISAATPAGANVIGDVGIQYRANAAGAASPASILSPATPAGASIKASAGRVVGYHFQNSSAALRSVKFFNATSVTMGTTSALFEIDIPAGGQAFMHQPGGVGFSTGIMWAVTGGKGLKDNTGSLGASDVSGVVMFA